MPTSKTPIELSWTDLDETAVNEARGLILDSIQRAGSGHPGAALSLAPLLHILYSKIMKHSPSDPEWSERDRLVLSCGHVCASLYVALYMNGYDLGIEDLKLLRQHGSRTPGHPEMNITPGI